MPSFVLLKQNTTNTQIKYPKIISCQISYVHVYCYTTSSDWSVGQTPTNRDICKPLNKFDEMPIISTLNKTFNSSLIQVNSIETEYLYITLLFVDMHV